MRVGKITELKDGGAELEIFYSDEEARDIRKVNGWKRLTKGRFQTFMNKALKEYIESEEKKLK